MTADDRGVAANDFDEKLETLPLDNPERAVELYAALARHDSDELRGIIAVRIDLLYALHPEAATQIWLHLFADRNPDVSEAAFESLELAVEGQRLTDEQAAPLIEQYKRIRADQRKTHAAARNAEFARLTRQRRSGRAARSSLTEPATESTSRRPL